MSSLGLFLWVVVATSACGNYLLSPLKLEWNNSAQRFVFSGALGLGLWLFLLFWGGWMIAYTPTIGLVITIVMTIPALFQAKTFLQSRSNRRLPADGLTLVLAGFCGIVILLSLAGSFAPIADMADVLAYQLNLPKEGVRVGHIRTFPYDINSAFPLLVNVGFGFGLLFRSPAFANLLSVWIGVLSAAGVYGWIQQQSSERYAYFGAAAFLLSPAVYNHINTPYVDLTLVLFSLVAFWSFMMWIQSSRSAWIGLSGIFCGFALCVKDLALIYVFLIAVAILVESVRKKLPASRCLRLLGLFGIFAVSICMVWYARSYAVMGNPVYPYYSKYFGGQPSLVAWHTVDQAHGKGRSLWNLVTLFWDATFSPEAYVGFGTRWNLLFLGLSPAVFWYVFRKKVGWVVFFALGIFLSWFFMFQLMRYLLPFYPLYCILLAWGLEYLLRGKKMLWTWILMVCAWELACTAMHARPLIQAGLSVSHAQQNLLKKESTYAMAQWVNDNLPSDARILGIGEQKFYYFNPSMIREEALRLFTRYPEHMHSPKETAAFFKSKGFTHVLVTKQSDSETSLVNDSGLFRLLHESGYHSVSKNILYYLYVIL